VGARALGGFEVCGPEDQRKEIASRKRVLVPAAMVFVHPRLRTSGETSLGRWCCAARG
jgi:hypothetical protein